MLNQNPNVNEKLTGLVLLENVRKSLFVQIKQIVNFLNNRLQSKEQYLFVK